MKRRVIIATILFVMTAITLIHVYSINVVGFAGDMVRSVQGFNFDVGEIANLGQKSARSDQDVKYKFAIISDSHADSEIYPKIIAEIKQRQDIQFLAHLGDHSSGGELHELQQSKDYLDRLSIPVYVLPGDHDLNWLPRRDLTNFLAVFQLPVTTYGFYKDQQYYMFIDNSDAKNGIPQEEIDWIKVALNQHQDKDIYVFMSTPLSNPYLDFKTMGAQSDKVKEQAKELGEILSTGRVKVIFAGDTHTYSQYRDDDTDIPIVTVGAVGTNKNPLPLYVVVEILSDGEYNVTSIPYY